MTHTRETVHEPLLTAKPTERPFLQSIEHGTTRSPYHRWQTDANEKGETFARSNRTQISTKLIPSAEIESGKNELAYLLLKHGVELLRDIEAVLLFNHGVREGQATQAPLLAGLPTWIETHAFMAPDGANATRHQCGCHTARTDGIPRPLTEPMLIELLEAVPDADLLLVPASFKPQLDTFSIIELPELPKPAQASTVTFADTTAELIWMDHGDSLQLVPNPKTRLHSHIYKLGDREVPLAFDRFMRQREIFAIEREMWALLWLRQIEDIELADSSRLLVAEYTLECRDQSRNGGLFDLEITK